MPPTLGSWGMGWWGVNVGTSVHGELSLGVGHWVHARVWTLGKRPKVHLGNFLEPQEETIIRSPSQ